MPKNSACRHTVLNKGRLSRPDIFCWEGSVLPFILPQVFIASLYALLVAFINKEVHPIAMNNSIIPSISSVVGLLLVFATNSSYDRYYEGRKLWSELSTQGRNMIRYLWLFIPSKKLGRDYIPLKTEAVKLVCAFLFSCKSLLRGELEEGQPIDPILCGLLPENFLEEYHRNSSQDGGNIEHSTSIEDVITFFPRAEYFETDVKGLPSAIIYSLSKILQEQNLAEPSCKGNIDGQCHNMMSAVLGSMVTTLANLERISRTPIPLAYKLHLVHTQGVYLIFLPLTLIQSAGYWAALIQAVVAFTFFGISAIGAEIENPFGYDSNDLPLDSICREFYEESIAATKKI